MELSVSSCQVQLHRDFLESVHDDALNSGSALYFNHGAVLSSAVARYEELWLPLLAAREQKGTSSALVPPIDIAWAWHLHRLAPLKYAAYCRKRFGTVLEPGASAFRLQSVNDGARGDETDCVQTRDVWSCAYPSVPFFLDASGLPRPGATESSLVQPIVATAQRQSTFLWQVSGPRFSDDLFLAAAIERYDKFLRLMGACGYRRHFYVPPYDVDLVWHTHMLASSCAYHEETRLRAGEPVDHDDSVNERHEGSKLNTSWDKTKELWRKTFGGDSGDAAAALDTCGACYRGEPPSWWFESRRHQRVRLLDEVVAEACCQNLAARIKGSRADSASQDQELELSLDVPSSLHEIIMSALQGGTVQQVACTPSAGGDAHMVPVPAKLSAKAVPLHQVASHPHTRAHTHTHIHVQHQVALRCCLPSAHPTFSPNPPHPPSLFDAPTMRPFSQDAYGGKRGVPVEGYSAALYLEGGGTMVFVDARTGALEREVAIVPGRMIVWENASLLHKVDVGGSLIPRVMLGGCVRKRHVLCVA